MAYLIDKMEKPARSTSHVSRTITILMHLESKIAMADNTK
jgi:hypothetical protein